MLLGWLAKNNGLMRWVSLRFAGATTAVVATKSMENSYLLKSYSFAVKYSEITRPGTSMIYDPIDQACDISTKQKGSCNLHISSKVTVCPVMIDVVPWLPDG